MREDAGKEILLLDSTLGIGGKLIGWDYGEAAIPNIRKLSAKSGLDIVEYGLLRSYPLGPDCAVSCSTILPPGFERERGQYYAMLLDRLYWPEISTLPEKSNRTADIIRVLITAERRDAELAYCAALRQKGYQIITLLEEAGQYGTDELSSLLQEVNAARPWACYLLDTSGVLTKKELLTMSSLCGKTLDSDVRIGFHGCDNLQCLFEMAKAFCGMEIKRGLCMDVSAGGIGVGPRHLSARMFAEWMNNTFDRKYNLPVLTFQETYSKAHMESKLDPVWPLLYYEAARNKCSYRYAEYYDELSVEPSDQLGIYEEIEHEFALQFDKGAANRALLRFKKKRLNLVIVIPTANRPTAINTLLYHAAQDLLSFGVDIVIYDSSNDERTHAAAMNFQIEGYSNVYYRRYTGEFDGISIDKKVMSALQEHLDYDYIWLCGDGLVPTISQFYYDLISLTERGMEFIAVDWSYRNDNRHCVKTYDNCVDFFVENTGRMNRLGGAIFKSSFMERLLKDQPLNESNYGFWIPMAGLHQMAKEPVLTGQIISNVFEYNPSGAASSYWFEGMLKNWGENWYRTVSGLPAVYDSGKPSVLKVHTPDFQPFALKSMLKLRSLGGFDLSIYHKYRDLLSHISMNPLSKFYFAALVPKSFAKFLIKVDGYWTAKPNTLFSRLISKLYRVYVRLGR